MEVFDQVLVNTHPEAGEGAERLVLSFQADPHNAVLSPLADTHVKN